MSDQKVKQIVATALLLHGFGHGGALIAINWIQKHPGSGTGGWHAARSWLLPSLSAGTATFVASIFWVLALCGFVAAALSLWDIFLPGGAWRSMAVTSAIVSIVGILLFIGTWPAFNTAAALGMDVAVLVALLAVTGNVREMRHPDD
ncbi:MAG TPA: hypothetical protein VNE17_04985 [Nitrolancea sp.]|nr:hypothetical protein [Nitrolancea sp.]